MKIYLKYEHKQTESCFLQIIHTDREDKEGGHKKIGGKRIRSFHFETSAGYNLVQSGSCIFLFFVEKRKSNIWVIISSISYQPVVL